ncbi:signal peptidase, endoplasmic reticulum-type [Paenibacillus sp. yr247]|uniref:signal peptidase I SipW n=1 Tax=Paenibacillus sp. yr247 TaxID=1761880 RepID=UPI00088CEA47|nr:signal peptidase I [Paenibacillus sp. yr247]SDO66351.1 signal peptidase, endoplasmic reticulum-type [Paenibacillus sp. yr247]
MKIRKVLSMFISFIMAAVLLITICAVVYSKVSGKTPELMGYKAMVVLSGSMEPSIGTGSVLFVKQVKDPSALQSGDVITYRSVENPDMLITHRIKEVQKFNDNVQYITKGDANNVEDPKPIPAGYIIGQYAGFNIPYFGYVSDFVKSKAGIIILLIVPGVILILWQVIGMWKLISRMDEKPDTDEQTVKS